MAGGRVTQTGDLRQHPGTVSVAEIRAMVDDAAAHGYGPEHGDERPAVGVFGDPAGVEPLVLEHRGASLSVVPAVSALAVREALLAHRPGSWLVVVTDRPESDLGAGILAHLVGHKLRTPDPWGAVRQQFAATGVEPALYAGPSARALAQGLLLSRPGTGWPPAPAGALTRDHALGAVARELLGLPPRSLDTRGVLEWTAQAGATARVADLRAVAGDELTEATLDWVCETAGASTGLLREMLRRGDLRDALPLGLVLDLLAGSPDGPLGIARLAHRWGGVTPPAQTLGSLGEAAIAAVTSMFRSRAEHKHARDLLTRADQLLAEADLTHLASASDVLPSGLTARHRLLAHHLRAAASGREIEEVEAGWARVTQHQLALPSSAGQAPAGRDDARLAPMAAAVRLARWLDSGQEQAGGSLALLALRQSRADAWVDRAVNDAHEGAADPELAEALTAVIASVQQIRDVHDREFAAALALSTQDGDGDSGGFLGSGPQRVWLLEHVLAKVVVPLAKATPVLLLVLDGMSTGVATEVVADVLDRREGWNEALLPEAQHRGAALAVLPTLTEVSRASLLCGRLTTGQQDKEQQGYAALTSAYGLGSSRLFHKKPLDTSRPGFAVADDVAYAVGDTEQRLVTCVLNTIDDALDRSDPAGTTWTADAVKHLRPLLDRALAAGRTVVLTADHGHVVERRLGTQRPAPDMSSGRSRSATPPAGADEVLVQGSRVLKHQGSAVLPATERLRYGPLKAGYHGGATPAEVVVPLVVLVPGDDVPEDTGLTLAPAQQPTWWDRAAAGAPAIVDVAVPAPEPAPSRRPKAAQDGPGLFDEGLLGPSASTPPAPLGTRPVRLGAAVVESEAYAAQRQVSGRIALTGDQVSAAVDALASTTSTRLAVTTLASVLSVPPTRSRGAVAHLQNLLNVEGYAVLRTEGPVVILDVPLLREQFGVTP